MLVPHEGHSAFVALQQFVDLRCEALERQNDIGKETRIERFHVVLTSLRAMTLADWRLQQVRRLKKSDHYSRRTQKYTNNHCVKYSTLSK